MTREHKPNRRWSWRNLFEGWSWRASPGRRPLRGKDLLFLSAPVWLLMGYVAIGAAVDFQNVRQFDDWWSNGVSLRGLVSARERLALNAVKAATIEQEIGPELRDAAIVRLHIPRDTWQLLTKQPQNFWGEWLEGELERDKTLHKVKIRRRGDSSVHWTTEKLTFTLRMDDKELLKGHPALVFSSKDVLTQFVAANLAADFDLLSPSVFVAPVFLNNRYYGIYRVVEPVDESFIRQVGHMPGNVFRGDGAERGDVFRGVPRGLFMNPYIWDLPAMNTRPAAPGTSALISFLEALNGSTLADHIQMMQLVQRDEVVRLTALMLFVGDLYHMDNVHNQLWYEDPWSNLLHPIPWDLRLLDLGAPPARVNRFLTAALRDPFLVDEVLREVHARLVNDSIERRANRLAEGTYDRFRQHFEYDRLRAGMIGDVGSPAEVRRVITGNTRLLKKWTQDARVAFLASPNDQGGALLDLETRGYTGADLFALNVDQRASAVRLFADRNDNGVLDAADPEVPSHVESAGTTKRLVLNGPEALLSGWDTRRKGVQPGTVHYRLFLTGNVGDVARVKPDLRNRVTGQRAQLLQLSAGQPRTPSTSWTPWQYVKPQGRTIRWSGDVNLVATTRIAETDTLVIAAGTRIRMAPDASLVVRGHMAARGSAAAPIVFEPYEPSRPWGAFALQGNGANGSVLEHVRFTRGGGSVVDRIEYSGMVNVHYAHDVTFDNAWFISNLRSDDSFHAMHAEVNLRNCYFTDSNGDAVDYDYSIGRIEGCRIEGSRNDALDLMTSSPEIFGNTLVSSGDKGISVGEDSHPLIFNNAITGCVRGIEIKDRSGPLIINNQITHNGLGIYAHLKNWRYGSGGWPRLVNTVVRDNKEDFKKDDQSRITSATSVTGPRATSDQHKTELQWVYAARGIAPGARVPGTLAQWAPAPRLAPVISRTFKDDFASISDGWIAGGGVTLLEKRNYALIAGLEKTRGSITMPLEWPRQRETKSHTLVLELAARDVDSVVITVRGHGKTVVQAMRPGTDISSFQFVEVPLPPGHYESIELAATPQRDVRRVDRQTGFVDLRAARIELGSWSLYERPVPSAADARIARSPSR